MLVHPRVKRNGLRTQWYAGEYPAKLVAKLKHAITVLWPRAVRSWYNCSKFRDALWGHDDNYQ